MSQEITLKVNGIDYEKFKSKFESTKRIFHQVMLQSNVNIKNQKGTYTNYEVTEDAFALLFNQLVEQRSLLIDLFEKNHKYRSELEEITFNLGIVVNVKSYLSEFGNIVREEKWASNKMFLTVVERPSIIKAIGDFATNTVKKSYDKTEFARMVDDFFFNKEDEAGNPIPRQGNYYEDNKLVQTALKTGRKVRNYFYEEEEVPVKNGHYVSSSDTKAKLKVLDGVKNNELN